MTIRKAQCLGLILSTALSFSVAGEIEKFARPGKSGIELVWWPKLPEMTGWVHDERASWRISANVLLPKGSTFSDSPVVIYANAIYKPRTSSKNLSQFIEDDQASFRERVPGIRIEATSSERDGDGKALPTFSFTPSGKGEWETIAYSEEGEYFLIFALSARTEGELRSALPTFHSLISRYHVAPPSKGGAG